MRAASILPLLLVGACSAVVVPRPPAPIPAACRIGPEGGPPLASDDRGIGGTGMLAENIADDDRGIGGTGIVGVVTGFASICVNGLHVGYAPGMPVAFGDLMARPDALRAGQVVVISATDRGGMLRARSVAVRYEVSGPVEAVEDGALRVAGQRITWVGNTAWRVGDAVLVSGLRTPDGSIAATRIDRRPEGMAPRSVTVHGVLSRASGVARIGNLPLRASPGVILPESGPAIASGQIVDGVLIATSVTPDLLMRDPQLWFGPGYERFVYEGYVSVGLGRVSLGHGLSAAAPAGAGAFPAQRGVVDLRRGGDGRLTATELRDGSGAAMPRNAPAMFREGPPTGASRSPGGIQGRQRGASQGELAPMPDRSFDARQGLDRPGQDSRGMDGRGITPAGAGAGDRSGGSDRGRQGGWPGGDPSQGGPFSGPGRPR